MIKNMDKKKFIFLLGGILGGIILIFIIILIVLSIKGNKMSFDMIENKLESAAISYFDDNKGSLPSEEGKSTTVDAETLSTGGYIKELTKLVNDKEVSCSAKVVVTKNGSRYLYSPMLNCGDKYKTQKMIDVVLDKSQIVTSKDGLYQMGDKKVYRGEYVKNYIKFSGSLWRIVDIDEDGYMRIMYSDKMPEEDYLWDDRYNIDEEDTIGINDYAVSRLKEALLKFDESNLYVSADDKDNVAYKDWCIGKRSETNLAINNDEECQTVISNQLFGLPYPTDYIISSIDSNCTNMDSESCVNYNYILSDPYASWTLIGSKDRSYKAYAVNAGGYVAADTNEDRVLRIMIYLSNNSLYAGGTGTETDPYIVK